MSIELQNIDCNCNDCKFMVRDFAKFEKWKAWNKALQEKEFERRKAEAFRQAELCPDEKGKKTLLHYAQRLKFTFDQSVLIHYGACSKFNKPVSFIPNICQIETQGCFENRKS